MFGSSSTTIRYSRQQRAFIMSSLLISRQITKIEKLKALQKNNKKRAGLSMEELTQDGAI